MRVTIEIDSELLARARALAKIQEDSLLVGDALRALVERESARELARLNGILSDLDEAPRRRPSMEEFRQRLASRQPVTLREPAVRTLRAMRGRLQRAGKPPKAGR
jgi:Arc/MetJ family transcription regulator